MKEKIRDQPKIDSKTQSHLKNNVFYFAKYIECPVNVKLIFATVALGSNVYVATAK